jgi:hypothetical protein
MVTVPSPRHLRVQIRFQRRDDDRAQIRALIQGPNLHRAPERFWKSTVVLTVGFRFSSMVRSSSTISDVRGVYTGLREAVKPGYRPWRLRIYCASPWALKRSWRGPSRTVKGS